MALQQERDRVQPGTAAGGDEGRVPGDVIPGVDAARVAGHQGVKLLDVTVVRKLTGWLHEVEGQSVDGDEHARARAHTAKQPVV